MDHRASMHPKTLEGILMLKENRSLWSAVLMQRGMKKHAASSSAGGEQYIIKRSSSIPSSGSYLQSQE
eukprot:gene11349-12673_t